MSDSLTFSSRAGECLAAMFAQYAAVNPREIAELVQKQGAELAGNLYLLTPRASGAVIQEKMDELGARFIRAPRAYAMKVGPKAKAYFKENASANEIRARKDRRRQERANKKGKNVPGFVPLDESIAGLRKGLTLTEEKFAATQLRLSRRGALASSWIPALKKLGSKLHVAKGDAARAAERPESEATITGNLTSVAVDILNRQTGIIKANNETRFVDSAFDKTTQNMKEYIDRKKRELSDGFKAAAHKARA